jgi:predicted dehydrogenase
MGVEGIKIALIGCGGRGIGAAANALANQGGVKVELVALADAFSDRIEAALNMLRRRYADQVNVPPPRQFSGLNCHEEAIANGGAEMVLLCSPPGFRPRQFEAAIKAGKHVFMEKPVAVDVPGVRRILAANEEAKKRGLAVAVGHHLRHEDKHREVIHRIHEGAIGEIRFLRAYFNSSGVWVRKRQAGQTEMQYQVRNWYYFVWLSGDHIVEQHVHDIDVCNWMMKDAHPIEAQGMGGRQVRVGPDVGEIFDHHSVEFTYPDGTRMFSQCRHIPGTWQSFSQHAHGTKGHASIEGHGPSELVVTGQPPQRWKRTQDGHQVEMDDLFSALRLGQPYNEGDWATQSTMTAILGRMASYSGKLVRWEDALQSNLELGPAHYDWNAEPPVKPGPDGLYRCALPGLSKAW